MFAWIARLLRRKPASTPEHPTPRADITEEIPVTVAPPVSESQPVRIEEPEDEAPAENAPFSSRPTEREIRTVDYAILLTDSELLEELPQAARYRELARRHGGVIQPSVSGLMLILFELEADALNAPGRLAFASELEKKSLARIRCLHGQSLAVYEAAGLEEGQPPVTLRNFHVLIQHAAALDLGTVTEAGSYLATRRSRPRQASTPSARH